jgi:ParB-like nuclease domain
VVEQIRAIQDFDAARFRAFWRALGATLTGRSRRLPSLDAVLAAAGAEGRSFGGVHEIPLNAIVGSASSFSKAGDFDPGFLPVSKRLRSRWTRIYREMVEGDELPPIDVYKVGDGYYVIDGHHRVSVARSLGRDTINARVVEVHTRAPLGTNIDPANLLSAAEYAAFLDSTQLHRTRPQARLECSRLGRYDEIFKHILGHRYFMGLEGPQPSVVEAAASWYDNVYTPIAEVIREHKVLEHLPGRTEADVYVEITRRWLALSQAGKPAGPHPAAHALLHDVDAMSWWQRRRSMSLPERRQTPR